MKKFLVAVGLAAFLVTFMPERIAAQCGYCFICAEPWGHTFYTSLDVHEGNEPHGCGGVPECSTGPHPICGTSGPVYGQADLEQAIMDGEKILQWRSLPGGELAEIVARSNGFFYLNADRKAIQRLDCEGTGQVVVNLPLKDEQLADFMRATIQ